MDHTDPIATLHRTVSKAAEDLAARLGDRLRCRRGCADCCVDDLTVFVGEAEAIRRGVGDALRGAEPHAEGACAFLDDTGACRVYAWRPYVCRTQGLPLRWFAEDDDDEIVELRDICPLNDDGDLASLADDDTWLLGPTEEQLVRIELERGNDELRRVALRDLFAQLASTRP